MDISTFSKHPLQLPTDRKFGLFFTFVFAAVATYFFAFHGVSGGSIAFGLLACLFLVTTLIRPNMLRPLNKFWAYIGLFLGMIISPIVLGIIYFGLFTPIAIFLRFRGRDELRLKNKKLQSSWIKREPAGPLPESFRDQF